MAVPWQVMLKDFERAPYHLQVQVEKVQLVEPLRAQVSGTVVRAFKGQAQPQQPIVLSVACLSSQDEDPPPGGDGYVQLEELQAVRFMELFLRGLSGGPLHPPYSFFRALPAPTDAPTFDVQEELRAHLAELKDLNQARRGSGLELLMVVLPLLLLALPVIWFFTLSSVAWWSWLIGAPVVIGVRALSSGERMSFGSWALLVAWIPSVMAAIVGS